jgi:predicted MPP superfamily phosphohydrolase
VLGGIDDLILGKPDWARMASKHGAPHLLLSHNPDYFYEAADQGVALVVSGHTHGGQIRLPFGPPLWVPSAYGARFAYGPIVESKRHMIVSGGLGCSGVPLRLGVPPEIVRVTLGV